MPVVATAGHVDHGKSTLIEALTGRDPDRLAEEKRRGLTIDLGFAWMELPSGRVVSFVDVPGHRRFVGNMLSGVGSVDGALLVVAADEGWKPQTEEHLAVLDALGIANAVVAVSKIDRVDQARVSALVDELGGRLAATTLASSSIVPVSAVTGYGLADLVQALDQALSTSVGKGERPRLWIDRAFSITGAGTIVTGTLTGGSLRVGDLVSIWPGHPQVRIRGLQNNEQVVESVDPSSRVAANLAGIEKADVGRGSLLTLPGLFLPTRRWLVRLRPARYEPGLPDRGAFLVHIGTHSAAIRLRRLVDDLALGKLRAPVWAAAGDRFVIRDSGRQLVVAGGVILDPDPPRRVPDWGSLGTDLAAAISEGPDRVAEVMLRHHRRARIEVLSAHSGGGVPQTGVISDGEGLAADEVERVAHQAVAAVRTFHTEHPLESGMAIGRLAEEVGISPRLLREVLTTTALRVEGSVVIGTESSDQLAGDPDWQRINQALAKAGPAPPSISELGLGGDLLHVLVRTGRLVRVSSDFVYLPDQLERLVDLMRSLGDFSVSDFRQRAGITRRHAIPILEWTDREGITIRQGDLRQLRS